MIVGSHLRMENDIENTSELRFEIINSTRRAALMHYFPLTGVRRRLIKNSLKIWSKMRFCKTTANANGNLAQFHTRNFPIR